MKVMHNKYYFMIIYLFHIWLFRRISCLITNYEYLIQQNISFVIFFLMFGLFLRLYIIVYVWLYPQLIFNIRENGCKKLCWHVRKYWCILLIKFWSQKFALRWRLWDGIAFYFDFKMPYCNAKIPKSIFCLVIVL